MVDMVRIGTGLNAFTVRFEDSLLDEIRDSYRRDVLPFVTDSRNRRYFEGADLYRSR